MKYFLYARKSTDVEDKQVLSIEAQLIELRSIARKNDLEIIEEFVEKKSAKQPGRPIFGDMMARIQKGEACGIICWKIDRLARNPVDGGQVQWLLQQGVIRHIQTHDRSHYPNDNVLMMSVELGMANEYIRQLSANTARGLRQKARQGTYPGLAPLGYINVPSTKTIRVHKKNAALAREMFEKYASGEATLDGLADFLESKRLYPKETSASTSPAFLSFSKTPFTTDTSATPESCMKETTNHLFQKPCLIKRMQYSKVADALRKSKPTPRRIADSCAAASAAWASRPRTKQSIKRTATSTTTHTTDVLERIRP